MNFFPFLKRVGWVPWVMFDGGIFRILNGLISVLEKVWFFHFLQILKTVKRKFFAESLCGIMHGRLPALRQGGHYYRNQASHLAIYLSPCVGEPSGRPASAWLCITLCGQALLLHNMPLFTGAYTYTNGFSYRRMFDGRREKKEDL